MLYKYITSEEDHLTENELEQCFKALNRNRKPGWDNIPIEAYEGSISAKQELFRIVRLIWDTELPPPDLVRGIEDEQEFDWMTSRVVLPTPLSYSAVIPSFAISAALTCSSTEFNKLLLD